jgi:hypothetical protein
MTEGPKSPDDNEKSQTSPDQTAKDEPAGKPAAEAAAGKPAGEAAEKPAEKPAVEKARGPLAALREPVVMWSVIGGAAVIVLAVGYVVWSHYAHHRGGSANALANRTICEATLDRVRDYGVLPQGATLSAADPDKTQVNGRVTCHAQMGQVQYAMTIDVVCDDMGKNSCLKLYSVKQADGAALFQRQT